MAEGQQRQPSVVDLAISDVKSWIAELVSKMATVEERRREAWRAALTAYAEVLRSLSFSIRWVHRQLLGTRVVVAEAPWAPQPQVTRAQLRLTYPLRMQHPVLGEVPYAASLYREYAAIDLRYQDIIDAIVSGSYKVVYAGRERRPVATSYFTECIESEDPGGCCVAEAVDGVHLCMAYYVQHSCGIYSAEVPIPEDDCSIIIIVFEERYLYVGCKSSKCCKPVTLGQLEANTDYDFATQVPGARLYIQSNCPRGAVLVTGYGNIPVPAAGETPAFANFVVAQVRGARDTCSFVFRPQV